MKTVTKREAMPAHLLRRKRVAAYTRTSNGKDAMMDSLSAQISYYSGMIQKRMDWVFAGVYTDEAVTGTKDGLRNVPGAHFSQARLSVPRAQFQRLLADCRAGLIDMVITKSITRFARNTVTTLETVRELKLLGVDVYFERENIHSMSGEGELMLTILASYAQEESRSVSENCKWRIRKDFQEGRPNIGRLLGYRLKDGVFVIVPEEAPIVKQIFEDYLSGMGTLAIQKKLLAQGVKLSRCGVRDILQQEKYIGDLLLQKTFTENHITKRGRKNEGQLPMYLVQGAHEPIIPREQFETVQREIARRAAQHWSKEAPCAAHDLSGMIRCGICGAAYHHKIAGAAAKYKKPVWICSTYNSLGKAYCASQMVPDRIMRVKLAEAGGPEGLREILVPGPGVLSFIYINGKHVDLPWHNPSRSESWTPEMREAVRQRNLQKKSRHLLKGADT